MKQEKERKLNRGGGLERDEMRGSRKEKEKERGEKRWEWDGESEGGKEGERKEGWNLSSTVFPRSLISLQGQPERWLHNWPMMLCSPAHALIHLHTHTHTHLHTRRQHCTCTDTRAHVHTDTLMENLHVTFFFMNLGFVYYSVYDLATLFFCRVV